MRRLRRRLERVNEDGHYHGWARWSHHVTKHPVIYFVVWLSVVVLLALGRARCLSLRLGQTDQLPEAAESHVAPEEVIDLLAEGFGPGFNGPLIIVVDMTDSVGREKADSARALKYRKRAARRPRRRGSGGAPRSSGRAASRGDPGRPPAYPRTKRRRRRQPPPRSCDSPGRRGLRLRRCTSAVKTRSSST